MKLLSATVVNGHLDVPEGTLPEGARVTLLVPEDESWPELTEAQQEELAAAVAEAERGERVDGGQLLDELHGA
jgi:hypothetical protein